MAYVPEKRSSQLHLRLAIGLRNYEKALLYGTAAASAMLLFFALPTKVFLLGVAGVVLASTFIALPKHSAHSLAMPSGRDCGILPLGRQQIKIPIQNAGHKTALITKIQSSCGCAIASAPEEIQPQSTSYIDVEISAAEGSGSASVMVQSDDGQTLVSHLSWFGRSRVRAMPPRVFHMATSEEQTFSREIRLHFHSGARVSINSVVMDESLGSFTIQDALHSIEAQNDRGSKIFMQAIPVVLNYRFTTGADSILDLVELHVTIDDEDEILSIPVSAYRDGNIADGKLPQQDETVIGAEL